MPSLSRLLGVCAIALVVTAPGPRAQAQGPSSSTPQKTLPEPVAAYPQIKITAGRRP